MPAKAALFICCLLIGFPHSWAQTIRGEVLDIEDRHAVSGVNINNIYTSFTVNTNDDGTFLIAAGSGELLEFKKAGYKTVRVRIPKGYVPSYFKIIMTKGLPEIQDLALTSNRYDFKADSMRYHDLYKHELDFPRLSAFDMIAHPFSALGSKNREIWRFQDEYDEFEKEKYVDKTFSDAVVTKFTGLQGDSLHYYMRRYRPSYEQLRSMNDYTFFNYIKTTVHQYRNRNTSRSSQ